MRFRTVIAAVAVLTVITAGCVGGVLGTTGGGGSPPVGNGDGGLATVARLYHAGPEAVDAFGGLLVADHTDSSGPQPGQIPGEIRRIDPATHVISNFAVLPQGDAGPIAVGPGGVVYAIGECTDSLGATAALYEILPTRDVRLLECRADLASGVLTSLAVVGTDVLYINDKNQIMRLNPTTGAVVTFAGQPCTPPNCTYTGEGGAAVNATLSPLLQITSDRFGNIYAHAGWSDGSDRYPLFRIDPNGIIRTVTQTDIGGIEAPIGMAVDRAGAVFVLGHAPPLGQILYKEIVRIDPNTGQKTVVAGQNHKSAADGTPAIDARIIGSGLAIDDAGTAYIADPSTGADLIRSISQVAASVPTPTGRYAALGDSYSSGEGVPSGIPPFESTPIETNLDGCHRSRVAYPELVRSGAPALIPTAFGFYACSGARVGDITTYSHDNEQPQIRNLDPSVTLVTMTIGGNDVGFVDVITNCLLLTIKPGTQTCADAVYPGTNLTYRAYVDQQIHSLVSRPSSDPTSLEATYAAIYRATAPTARLRVLGYPRGFVPNPTAPCDLAAGAAILQPSDQRWINSEIDLLNYFTAIAAGADFVDAGGLFAGHELCTSSPALNPVEPILPYSLHPNALGQKLYAIRLLESL